VPLHWPLGSNESGAVSPDLIADSLNEVTKLINNVKNLHLLNTVYFNIHEKGLFKQQEPTI
jgi:hypothetical protein